MRWYQRLIGRGCGSPSSQACSETELSSRPYAMRPAFLSPRESQLFHQLDAAVGDRVRVFPKVRVADVLAVCDAPRHLDAAVAIDRKSVGFLLCDRDSLQPVAVVGVLEAAAIGHDGRVDHQRVTTKVEQAFCAAGIPVAFVVPEECREDDLRRQLLPLLEVPETPPEATVTRHHTGSVRVPIPAARATIRPAESSLPATGANVR